MLAVGVIASVAVVGTIAIAVVLRRKGAGSKITEKSKFTEQPSSIWQVESENQDGIFAKPSSQGK